MGREFTPTLDTRIQYVIAYEDEAEGIFSPFRGFRLATLRAAPALQLIALLPTDVRQYAYDVETSTGYRAVGLQPYSVLFCPAKHLAATLERHFPQFLIVLFDAASRALIGQEMAPLESGHRALLLEWPGERKATLIADLAAVYGGLVAEYVQEAVASLATAAAANVARPFGALAMRAVPSRRNDAATWPSMPINALLPTQSVLATMGYELTPRRSLRSLKNAPYFEAIGRAADTVTRERFRLFGEKDGPLIRTENDMLLVAPTMYAELRGQSLRQGWAAATGVPANDPTFQQVSATLFRRKTFLPGATATRAEANVLQSELGTALVSVNGLEETAIAAYLSLLASNCQAPALQWAPDVGDAYAPLVELTRHFRRNELALLPLGWSREQGAPAPDLETMNRFAQVQDAIGRATPEQYLELLRRPGSAKIVADLPLEWLDVDGLPLMLARETSRLPVTPGMVMSAQLTPPPLLLPRAACRHVLVLTGFDHAIGEPSELVAALNAAQLEMLDVTIEVVRTAEDVLRCLHDFTGPLVVFDMHGRASPNDLFGELLLAGGGTFSPARHLIRSSEGIWQRPLDVRVPPIVILSACDTLAIDSPSGSAAYAFLLGGAHAVLATFLPVITAQGGIFVGRLLRRFDEFLRLAGRNHPVRWRQLVWDTQRLTYLTELFWTVRREVGDRLSTGDFGSFGVETGSIINAEDPRFAGGADWFTRAVALLAGMCALSEDEMRHIVRERARFTDVMNYVQVGFPERVLIASANFEKVWPHLAQMQWQEGFNRPGRSPGDSG